MWSCVRTAPWLGLPLRCWCVSKCWYLEGMLWFTSKGCIFFTGLLSHHHSLSPRYMFHVLKNSIAPCPLVHARHLDRLDPFSRDRWINEWRSLRGGGQVKHSRLSTPTSSTLEAPVEIYPQSPTNSDVVGDEFTLNVFSEKRPVHAWETQACWTWSNLKDKNKDDYLFRKSISTASPVCISQYEYWDRNAISTVESRPPLQKVALFSEQNA